jgi:hypothetical protein
MNNTQLIAAVAIGAAIVSYFTHGGAGLDYGDAGSTAATTAGALAPHVLHRMLADVRACTVDAQRDASGGLTSGSCTVLRAGEDIEVQFWFSENSNARVGDRDLQPCVRAASWPREAGVRDPRESKDCVVVSRDDFE